MFNVGRARCLLTFSSLTQTYADGSRFNDVAIFKNLNAKIAELKAQGYVKS